MRNKCVGGEDPGALHPRDQEPVRRVQLREDPGGGRAQDPGGKLGMGRRILT